MNCSIYRVFENTYSFMCEWIVNIAPGIMYPLKFYLYMKKNPSEILNSIYHSTLFIFFLKFLVLLRDICKQYLNFVYPYFNISFASTEKILFNNCFGLIFKISHRSTYYYLNQSIINSSVKLFRLRRLKLKKKKL